MIKLKGTKMGRIGISYLEVAKVATELQGKSINPTVDNVREILGTGSRSTIGPYLKQWRSKQEEGGYHPGLPPELSSLVKGLYERLQEEANAKVEALEQSARDEILGIQQKLTQSIAHSTTLEQEVQTLHQKLMTAQNSNEQLALELEQTRKDNSGLVIKLQEYETRHFDKEQQIKILEKQFQTVQSNLEHYRESAQVQREQQTQANEREVFLLNQEITLLKQQMSEIKTADLALTKKMDVLQAEKQQLEKDWYEQRGKTMALQEKLKTDEFILKNKEDKYNELSTVLLKNQEELKRNLEITRVLENENLVLQEKSNAYKISNIRLQDEVKKLQADCIFLAQESLDLKVECKNLGKFMSRKESN